VSGEAAVSRIPILTLPKIIIILPKATIPHPCAELSSLGVQVIFFFFFLHPVFQRAAGWAQRAENLDVLWPETAGGTETLDTFIRVLFTVQDCEMQWSWKRLPEIRFISPPISP
jgi:hypothetical protein